MAESDESSDDGRLTEEERTKVVNWINEKAPLIGKCPICGERHWSVLEHLMHSPVFRRGGRLVLGGTAYPNVAIICNNCGNTQFLNAIMVGVIKKADQEAAPTAEAEKSEASND